MKSAEIILPAYNDKEGYTRDFNLNLLKRINDELEANFDIGNFMHRPEYDEKEGIAKSFLVSKKEQVVTINSLQKEFKFLENEKIHTEVSRKYNDTIINKILGETDFKIKAKLTDSKKYFANYILNRG